MVFCFFVGETPAFDTQFDPLFALAGSGGILHCSPMALIIRGTTYYLRRRVPNRYSRVESRSEILHSLSTDSLLVAEKKMKVVWDDLVESWEARLAGDTADADARYNAARNLSKMRGFRYLPSAQVAKLPLEDLLTRVEKIPTQRSKPNLAEAQAVLGLVDAPEITIERALELFWSLADDRTLGKSDDQVRRWKNPRKKAVANFVDVVGNVKLTDLTADHMLDFRDWWFDKIKTEGLTTNSGNKDLTHLGNILKTVNTMKRLGLTLPLAGISFKAGEAKVRPPFSDKWISQKLLAPGALTGLNLEARTILLGMINTGYRPSEGAGLRAQHIRLDTEIPHISIEAVGRTLKNASSKRVIPLAGISLEAFKACPGGFPRYHEKDSISAVVNKFLRENNLLETEDHTMYCLRHSFEDRMLAAEVDERIRRDLFGHALNRERYGAGATLEHKLRIINLIAL